MPDVVHRDLTLGHGFQQGALGARRGAIDLVGQEHVGKDGPGQEFKLASVLIEDAEPGDVARQQIGRALDRARTCRPGRARGPWRESSCPARAGLRSACDRAPGGRPAPARPRSTLPRNARLSAARIPSIGPWLACLALAGSATSASILTCLSRAVWNRGPEAFKRPGPHGEPARLLDGLSHGRRSWSVALGSMGCPVGQADELFEGRARLSRRLARDRRIPARQRCTRRPWTPRPPRPSFNEPERLEHKPPGVTRRG